ncbi:MAG: DUF3999 domain-containing protein [Desulfobulbaceae bacterium]|jgi:hypothetical protein|nr:DUF3999 domain-containing protein [Desulfobulbaceae bacterium]
MNRVVFPSFLIFLFFISMLATTEGKGTTDANLEKSSKTGFANFFALELEGKASYYLFALTTDVYRASINPDGRDLRIVDANGNLAPYAFGGNIETTAESSEDRSLHPVPWFPLPRAESDQKVQDGFIIASDGTLRSRERQAEPERRGGDIVDLSGLAANNDKKFSRLNALVIHIGAPAAGKADYLGAAEVLASDDLQNWRPVTTAQLLRLDHGGQRLEQERIDFDDIFAARPPHYLQLRWRVAPPLIAGVDAELLTPRDGTVPQQLNKQSEFRYWREKLPGQTESGGNVFFDTGGVFPVDRLRVHLPRLNTVVPVKLYSRANEQALWRLIGGETLYRLQGPDGSEQETPEMRIALNRDRLWKMTMTSDSRGSGAGNDKERKNGGENQELGGAPLLSVGWKPETITFLAGGTPPFLLAVGNAQATDASTPLAQLLAGDKPYLATAQIGAAQPPPANAPTVDIPSRQRQDLPPGERIRRFILWGVLLATVALLAFMAWKLAKRLPPAGDSEDDDREKQNEER